MSNHTHNDEEPMPRELDALRASLLAHAGEIAHACALLAPGQIVYACTARDGCWWGLLAAQVGAQAGPYLHKDGLCFAFPPRCRTGAAVRALVADHLGHAGEE